ncbi:hypothetical protein Slin15195_G040390 [Septoria linicola]|uniref:Uncharacterized protein n=1 Tax=Septoria linicola TaxID=215465 RepID=A0A9Q9AKJ2_9PEZI|nr:hypothetical protein Slin14017_G043920 [Septoria linicola]USW50720.1 hypothetical protein Slin15195_G040390 [Septoria linicola]
MVDTGPNVLGDLIAGISSDSWYSIQAFASDYYLGLNDTTTDTPVPAQLSNVEDPTLWQFVASGPEASQGVYALRSKAAEGRFCLYSGCSGPEICVEGPSVQPCGNDTGQFQLYNSSSESGGVIFTTYQSDGRSALSVFSGSSEGDPIEGTDLAVSNTEEGDYLWAIRREETVDDAAFPVTFTPIYATAPTSSTTSISSSTTQSSSSTTGAGEGPSTTTQTTIITSTPATTTTESASPAESSTETTTSETSETSAPAQQPGSSASRTDLSVKAVVAGLAFFSLLGLSM